MGKENLGGLRRAKKYTPNISYENMFSIKKRWKDKNLQMMPGCCNTSVYYLLSITDREHIFV